MKKNNKLVQQFHSADGENFGVASRGKVTVAPPLMNSVKPKENESI